MKDPFEIDDREMKELDWAIKHLRGMLIKGCMSQMSWKNRQLFRLYLAWSWVVKKGRIWHR